MKTEDTTKLPKWAQRRIQVLEMQLEEANAKLAQGPENSNTFVEPYSDVPRPLGEDAAIQFVFGVYTDGKPKDYIQARIKQNSIDGPHLDIYGSDSFAVLPQSSNVVKVRFTR